MYDIEVCKVPNGMFKATANFDIGGHVGMRFVTHGDTRRDANVNLLSEVSGRITQLESLRDAIANMIQDEYMYGVTVIGADWYVHQSLVKDLIKLANSILPEWLEIRMDADGVFHVYDAVPFLLNTSDAWDVQWENGIGYRTIGRFDTNVDYKIFGIIRDNTKGS